MKMVSVAEMRAIEAEANQHGLSYEEMMRRAGIGVAGVLLEVFGEEAQSVLGLVGPGNNGGDTLIALKELAETGWTARAYLLKEREASDPLITEFLKAGGELCLWNQDRRYTRLRRWVDRSTIILDGLLGTGVELPLRKEAADLLAAVKSVSELPAVIAVDCPSGVNCDSGEMAPETLKAELTICMAAVKEGLLKFPAFDSVGNAAVVDLGFDENLPTWKAIRRQVANEEMVSRMMPVRPNDAHKGTFGTALICAGSLQYTGAALLAGEAAYRSGAGLVRMMIPAELHAAIAGHLPEAVWTLLKTEEGALTAGCVEEIAAHLDRASAMLLGPGWGSAQSTGGCLRRLLDDYGSQLPPLVIDADGLRHLAGLKSWERRLPAGAVLTPHPGEMAALSGLSVEEIQRNRIQLAGQFADQWDQIVVLKGALTVIAVPNAETYVVPVATAALARAGTGDVLAGLITGLRAQGLSPTEAALAGVWIHAQAGLAAEIRLSINSSVLARDVLGSVPEVIARLY